MDEDTRKDVWGHGIPQYTKDDLLKVRINGPADVKEEYRQMVLKVAEQV